MPGDRRGLQLWRTNRPMPETQTVPLPPNSTIGIIGGGQLARMLASSAAKLGYRTIVLEPTPDCPAAQLANHQIVAAYDDDAALAELRAAADVVTYEFENVPLHSARVLERDVHLYPPARALEVSQDRLIEKTFLKEAGIEVAAFANIENVDSLEVALGRFGSGVLKTRRFGYDGKGQHVFRPDAAPTREDLVEILDSLGNPHACVLEQFIKFRSEFSIIAVRGQDGSIEAFEPSRNTHEAGILRRSIVPAGLSEPTEHTACQVATSILTKLDYVGALGIEFFETDDGLLVNEIAPRVHNTGHWTVEACYVSQFEQHIRAIVGLRLGSTHRHSDCEMVNLLGDEIYNLSELAGGERDFPTLYGKSEARPGRKMGHVTRLTS